MIKLVTLGGVAISENGVQLVELTALRQKVALLAYLSLEGPVSRDRLLPLFWPDRAGERARHALSQALYVLKQELGEQCVRVSGDQVAVVPGVLDVDARQLQDAAAKARWEHAASIYQGPFLDEFHLLGAPLFEHWQTRTRARRAKEAERALEGACIRRFGTLRPSRPTPVVRSDNGLAFQSRRFRGACRQYRLGQEFITPYTPEQNGIVERFFRSLKEECVWQHQFGSFAEARRVIGSWIRWYNQRRPHQSLGYLSPLEYRARQQQLVA
jgi:putative transposase